MYIIKVQKKKECEMAFRHQKKSQMQIIANIPSIQYPKWSAGQTFRRRLVAESK